MIGYPTNRLLAVIDDATAAVPLKDAICAAGIDASDVTVLTGDDGVAALRRLGGTVGLVARFVRMFQFMSMDQTPDFLMYEAAIRDGRAVIAVRPRNRAAMLHAWQVLAGHRAHFANWFGRFSTEEVSLWRGPEPPIPGYLRR